MIISWGNGRVIMCNHLMNEDAHELWDGGKKLCEMFCFFNEIIDNLAKRAQVKVIFYFIPF